VLFYCLLRFNRTSLDFHERTLEVGIAIDAQIHAMLQLHEQQLWSILVHAARGNASEEKGEGQR